MSKLKKLCVKLFNQVTEQLEPIVTACILTVRNPERRQRPDIKAELGLEKRESSWTKYMTGTDCSLGHNDLLSGKHMGEH